AAATSDCAIARAPGSRGQRGRRRPLLLGRWSWRALLVDLRWVLDLGGRTKEVVEGCDQNLRRLARDRVMDRLRLAAGADQFVGAQPRQMLRHRGHAEADGLVQGGHRALA